MHRKRPRPHQAHALPAGAQLAAPSLAPAAPVAGGTVRIAGRLAVHRRAEAGLRAMGNGSVGIGSVGIGSGYQGNRFRCPYRASLLDAPWGDTSETGTVAHVEPGKGVGRAVRSVLNAPGARDAAADRTVQEAPVQRGSRRHTGGNIGFGGPARSLTDGCAVLRNHHSDTQAACRIRQLKEQPAGGA